LGWVATEAGSRFIPIGGENITTLAVHWRPSRPEIHHLARLEWHERLLQTPATCTASKCREDP